MDVPKSKYSAIYKLIGAVAVAIVCSTPSFGQDESCHDQWPAWGPSGDNIVFVSTHSGDHEVYLLHLPTGRIDQLTDVPGRDAHPSISPDGKTIAFQSPRGSDDTHLYVMDIDGSNVRQITDHPGFSGVPVWSPDGTRLAYQWRSPDDGARWQLMSVDLSTGTTKILTDGTSNDQVVNWSPDGKRLVFHSDRTGTNQLYILKGNRQKQIASTSWEDKSASWSPKGDRIAFISNMDGEKGIYEMSVDGTGRHRIGTISVEHGLPFYSPDGGQLLITPTRDDGVEIWTVDVETGEGTKVSGVCDL